jgi:hypothetical protein
MHQTVGLTPRPIRTGSNLISAARPIWTESNRFGHQNGSIRWRCPHIHPPVNHVPSPSRIGQTCQNIVRICSNDPISNQLVSKKKRLLWCWEPSPVSKTSGVWFFPRFVSVVGLFPLSFLVKHLHITGVGEWCKAWIIRTQNLTCSRQLQDQQDKHARPKKKNGTELTSLPI